MNIRNWLGQPSTISGLGNLAMVAVGAAVQLMLHQIDISAVAGIITKALVSTIMPDNTAAPVAAQQLITDAATAVANKHIANALTAAMPQITADATTLLQGLLVAQRLVPAPVAQPSNPVSQPAPTPTPGA